MTELVISLEFARKQRFKLKKIERLIYMKNVNETINKGLIENTVKVNIHYQGHRDQCDWRLEVDCDFRNIIAYSL